MRCAPVGRAGGWLLCNYGYDYELGGYAMFQSVDGLVWNIVTDSTSKHVAAGLLWLVEAGNELTAFVSDSFPGKAAGEIQVWRADDGPNWRQLGVLPNSESTVVEAAAVGPRGWVAIGHHLHYRRDETWADQPLAWTSADGVHWRAADVPPDIDSVYDVLPTEVGFIVTGSELDFRPCGPVPVKGQTWTSVDGSIWRRMSSTGWNHRAINALIRMDRTVIGVGPTDMQGGDDYGFAAFPGAVWTARVPDFAHEPGGLDYEPILREPPRWWPSTCNQ
jgi:hypothetical protein